MPPPRIPFFGNAPDDLHCFQAVFKMVLKHFEPEAEYSWSDLEKITAMKPGMWTWPTAGLLALSSKGYEIRGIDSFDPKRLVIEGATYMLEFYGKDVGEAQLANCDINQEIQLLRRYLNEVGPPEIREPTFQDVRQLLREGYVPIVNLNSQSLNGRVGYTGHFVLVLSADLRKVEFHDPGLPPKRNRTERLGLFERAWAFPDKKAKGLVGIRKKSPEQTRL